MGDNGILLGKRQFLYFTEQTVKVEGWTFSLAPDFKTIAGGSANPIQTLVSIYRESEKVAQLLLTHRRMESDLTVQAVSSEILLEIMPQSRMVHVTLKG
ncbi:MAG TPA: hypothetical protein VE710_12725 [Candidatus Bathyarchaeia archaeon]|nr:hypothetical protein [Candidatus Bathyarchaeia archaeon]